MVLLNLQKQSIVNILNKPKNWFQFAV